LKERLLRACRNKSWIAPVAKQRFYIQNDAGFSGLVFFQQRAT